MYFNKYRGAIHVTAVILLILDWMVARYSLKNKSESFRMVMSYSYNSYCYEFKYLNTLCIDDLIFGV
jgi:hypothetical protein